MRLPVWLLGFANLPVGWVGGLALLTVPQLLAARHVPEPVIAAITTAALAAGLVAFVFGPLIDIWLPRRTWAAIFTVLTAVAIAVAIVCSSDLIALAAALVFGLLAAQLNYTAVGGWLGELIPEGKDATLGAWLGVANIGGFGVFAMVGVGAMRALPTPLAAVALATPCLLPLAIYAVTPCPPPSSRLAHESFSQFFSDLGALLRQPIVLQSLFVFLMPSASFALTNTLGGLGRDYGASEGFVSLIGGGGAIAAGVVGSLLVPPLAKRLPTRPLYLGIGALGALFTLSLIVLPRTPLLYAIALIGQNVAQSAALATVAVIALQSLGKDNPFAATQFGLLVCASVVPITYMQLIDGHAYGAGKLPLMYLADGGLGLFACVVLALLLRQWARKPRTVSP